MFSRYSENARASPKTLLFSSDHDNLCCKQAISQLQGAKTQQPSFFHIGYTYASYDDDIINIYTVESSSGIPPELIKSVDLTVHVLDYERDPHDWIDILSKPMPESHRTILVVYNRERADPDLDQETHEYIQLALRSVCLKEGFSLMYCSDGGKIAELLKQMLFSHEQPKFTAQDYRELFFFQGTDSWTKIAAIGGGEDPEDACREWRVAGFGDYAFKVPSKATSTKTESTKPETQQPLPFDEFLVSLV